ncbi:MAG: TPM domain-containing protein [Ignavibacteriales bacterium]|nr:MAG: TPM domain-containing protein [Ignavibacteriales bacterium]
MKNGLLYNYLDDDQLLRISNKIKEMEASTSGEIRVSIKEKKPFRKKNNEIKTLAQEEFFKLKMDSTRDKTGIIIFILLREKQFYILADSGINEKVEQDKWDKIRDQMQEKFQKGYFAEGILLGIEKVGSELAKYFPIKSDDTNELSNRVAF